MQTTRVPSAPREQKMMLVPLELELQMAITYHVSAENQTQVL